MIRFLQTPGPLKKIVLGGILVVICVMMVITLVPGGLFGDYLGLNTTGVLAKVGDQDISLQEVSQQARLMGRQQFRGNVPEALMPYLMQRVAEQMISEKALLYEANQLGLGVSDKELSDFLHQGQWGQVLFPGGNFIGQDRYADFIYSQFGISVAQFESELKSFLARNKLLTTVTASVTASDQQIMDEVKRQNTKVKFDYAVLTLSDVEKQINPAEAELRAFYEQNKQRYVNSIPEKRKARYIVLDSAKLADKVTVSQDDLQRYYSQHQDEFRIPETVTVRHILVKTPTPGPEGKVDQKAVDAAKAKADNLLKQLKSGADFAKLAKENSEDPGSAKDGGLLPAIKRGQTVPEFEQAAFSTPKGQMTGVIHTSYGFHIIRVEDKQAARLKPLDEVKAEIEPIIRREKAGTAAQTEANAVQLLARTQGFDKAAAAKGLTVTTTDALSRTDMFPGIGTSQEFGNALFAAKKDDPAALSSIQQGFVIYQVTDIVPAQTPTFEQARGQVEQQFRAERAQAMLSQKTQQLADRAHIEHDLKKAAKEIGATIKTSDLVDPTAQVPDVGSMSGQASVAFTLKPGEISGPIQTGNSGAVLAVLEKQEPTPDQVKQAWQRAKESILEQKRADLEQLYVQNLRDRLEKDGKIKINKKEMQRLVSTAGA